MTSSDTVNKEFASDWGYVQKYKLTEKLRHAEKSINIGRSVKFSSLDENYDMLNEEFCEQVLSPTKLEDIQLSNGLLGNIKGSSYIYDTCSKITDTDCKEYDEASDKKNCMSFGFKSSKESSQSLIWNPNTSSVNPSWKSKLNTTAKVFAFKLF